MREEYAWIVLNVAYMGLLRAQMRGEADRAMRVAYAACMVLLFVACDKQVWGLLGW